MTLKTLMDFILEQGKYVIIMGIVWLASKNFIKSKIAQVVLAFIGGAVAYFFMDDPERLLNAIGTIIEKIIGG